MDIWSWICELPDSAKWDESDSPPTFLLVSSKPTKPADASDQSIKLRAERTSGSDSEALVTFSIYVHGFHPSNAEKALWVSDACPLTSEKPFLPLLLQLIQETISRSPTAHDSTCPRSQLQKLRPEPVAWVLDSHSPQSLSTFFNLVFLTRLFWLCVCDAPSEVGSLYFQSLLTPHIELFSCNRAHVLRTFLLSIGVDAELCFMRSIGYMLAKWLILKEVGVGLQMLTPVPKLGFSYATEAHGLWVLKAHAPVMGMTRTLLKGPEKQFSGIEAKDTVLKYSLAHQQLEAVIQLEYSVNFHDGYIEVGTRVSNLRFHIVKLGYTRNDDMGFFERHFPSRVRVWVGPEVGSTYVASLTLGRSTENVEKEVKTQRIVKGNFGKMKVPNVKATTRQSTRTKTRNWRWDQDAEGNAAIFEAVLCEESVEVATNKPPPRSEGDKSGDGLTKRYSGGNRMLSKSGGLVFAGDEYGERVEWRINKEMEGSVLKWRIGGRIWLSHWPNNESKTAYFETRCVEWCDEVDLPLIPCK